MTLRAILRGVRPAFAFLTRLPVGGFPYTDDESRWAAAHFPLVGAAVGAAAGYVDRGLQPLGHLASGLAAVATTLVVTGALHEDGLADTCDALGGAFDREKVFAILKDSRVGTFGACAVALSIAGRAALVAHVGEAIPSVLALTGASARLGPVWLLASMKYVTPPGLARSSAIARAGAAQACLATAWTLLLAAALVGSHALSASRVAATLAGVAAVALLCGRRYANRLGGVTGDFLGATEQLGEIVALGVFAWSESTL